MTRWLLAIALVALAFTPLPAAEENFSQQLRPADFAAAGLGKLSPDEVARLDAFVRDFKSGALERARREAAAAEARAAQAEAQAAARAQPGAADNPGMLAKAKVLLTPGTEVGYAAVESRIVGEFRGWEGRTIFMLENGQRWQAAGSATYVAARPMVNPAVKITPGMLGTFWMTVEGVKPRVKVTLIDSR